MYSLSNGIFLGRALPWELKTIFRLGSVDKCKCWSGIRKKQYLPSVTFGFWNLDRTIHVKKKNALSILPSLHSPPAATRTPTESPHPLWPTTQQMMCPPLRLQRGQLDLPQTQTRRHRAKRPTRHRPMRPTRREHCRCPMIPMRGRLYPIHPAKTVCRPTHPTQTRCLPIRAARRAMRHPRQARL
jgi:hypothetical protein